MKPFCLVILPGRAPDFWLHFNAWLEDPHLPKGIIGGYLLGYLKKEWD